MADGADVTARLETENAELRERLEATERYTALTLARATRLSQIVSVLGNEADLDEVIERASVTVMELFFADIAVLMLGDDDALRIAGHWGMRPRDLPESPFALGHSGLLTSAQVVCAGPAADVLLPDWLAPYRARHAAWVRLLVGDESLGVMLIARRGDIPFEASDERELKAVASRLALSIENGLLHQRMTTQIAQLRRMHAFTIDLAGELEVAAVAALVANAVVSEADAGASAVLLPGRAPIPSAGAEPDHGWARLPITTAAGTLGHLAVRALPAEGSDADGRLGHLLGLAGLALEKALLYEHSREQARSDSLTGLLLHRPFHVALAELEREAEPFSLVIADIDDFKQINDLYGHPAGDEALREVASVMTAEVRAEDTVYRTGGEEFCVLLPGLGAEEAFAVAERLRRGMARVEAPLPVTISSGVASFPFDAASREALIERADGALYASKHAGKNRTTSAHAADDTKPGLDRGGLDLRLLHDQDPATAVHSVTVSNLSVATARRLGLAAERLPALRTAARLHDIGKIAIPREVLLKPGRLDADEFRVIQTHPVVGAELLRATGHDTVARFVAEHHENIDGTGYPAGLSGEDIALESRIIRVVDAYLAMTLDRPYRPAMTPEAAAAELRRCRGTHFDADVVDALLNPGVLADAGLALAA